MHDGDQGNVHCLPHGVAGTKVVGRGSDRYRGTVLHQVRVKPNRTLNRCLRESLSFSATRAVHIHAPQRFAVASTTLSNLRANRRQDSLSSLRTILLRTL